MTADLWDALAKTNEQVARLLDVIDGPTYVRVDGSISRDHSEGLLGSVAGLANKVEALTDATNRPTRIQVPAWAVTILVALISAMGAIGVALIDAIGDIQ